MSAARERRGIRARAGRAGGPRPEEAGGPRPEEAGSPLSEEAGRPRSDEAGGPRPEEAGSPRPEKAGGPRPRRPSEPPTREPPVGPPEERESLWTLAGSPLVWGAHFLLAYGTAAVWCAKAAVPDQPLGPVRITIAAYTVVALAAIALIGWRGWRRHALGRADLPHDVDTPEDRHRFLGFATLLLSGLSAVAVVYEALPAIFIETCW